jgi:ABC-type branched-subunit amino acid transport system substrate-binding protein
MNTPSTPARRTRAVAFVLAVAATVALVGCASPQSSAAPSTVKVMFAGMFSGDVPLPMSRDVAKASVDRINAAGGVDGRQLDVVYCDDRRDPNLAAQCARDAVQQGVVAYLSAEVNFADVVLPVLEAGGIPMIKAVPSVPAELSSPASYPILSGIQSYGGATGIAMAQDGCKRPTVVVGEAASSQFLSNAIVTGLKSANGATPLPPTTVTTSQADVTPTVLALMAAGVDCLGVALPIADTLRVTQSLAAANAGITVYGAFGVIVQSIIDQLKGAVPMVVVSDFPVFTDTSLTDLDVLRSDFAAAGLPPDAYGAWGWYLVDVFRQILGTIPGDVTSASVTSALDGMTEVQLPDAQPVDFSRPFDVPGYERLFNRTVRVQDVVGTTLVERGDVIDVSDFFRAFAAQ